MSLLLSTLLCVSVWCFRLWLKFGLLTFCTDKTFPKGFFGPASLLTGKDGGWLALPVCPCWSASWTLSAAVLSSVTLYTLMAVHSCINNLLEGSSSIRKINLTVEKLFENSLQLCWHCSLLFCLLTCP